MSAVTWYCVTRTPETSTNGSVIVSYYWGTPLLFFATAHKYFKHNFFGNPTIFKIFFFQNSYQKFRNFKFLNLSIFLCWKLQSWPKKLLTLLFQSHKHNWIHFQWRFLNNCYEVQRLLQAKLCLKLSIFCVIVKLQKFWKYGRS